tara:strand:+ start:659 stop:1105 length:447 start_codon:yes stop_codon:yes gene_type:complete
MKLLFENWRKYITEADTDNDGIDDEKELAIVDKGELGPVADASGLSEESKEEFRSFLQAWFDQAVISYGVAHNPNLNPALVRDLEKGIARQPHNLYSAKVDFNLMLQRDIVPEEHKAADNLLGVLIDKIEQNPDLEISELKNLLFKEI